jgi:hypothetical protein
VAELASTRQRAVLACRWALPTALRVPPFG